MSLCKICKEAKDDINAMGFCESCYKSTKAKVKSAKETLANLRAESITAAAEKRPEILANAEENYNLLLSFARKGFPIDRNALEKQMSQIRINCGEKAQNLMWLLMFFAVLTLLLSFSTIYLGVKYYNVSNTASSLQQTCDEQTMLIADLNSQMETLTESKSSAPVRKNYSFSSGNYVAGKDFPAGTYNISATSGFGNVSTDDFSLNAIMGVKSEDILDIAEQTYSNVQFDEGVTLSVDGVKIKMVLKD